MNFNEYLRENSLYTDATSKAALASDKERLMDSLMFNFFGFLGLYNLSDSRGYMRTYETTEGKLTINDISDSNHDVSLSVKMAYDAGLITQTVVIKMTRLLALIKQKKLKGKDLDVSVVRSFLDQIHYSTHRPSAKVFLIMQRFHDGATDLPNLAKELYLLSKLREYRDITSEFRGLVMKGQYNDFFTKLAPSTSSATEIPPSDAAPNVQKQLGPMSQSVTQTDGAQPKATTVLDKPVSSLKVGTKIKLGQVDEFMDAIFDAKDQTQFENAFKEYGVAKSKFDFNKFEVWFSTAKERKSPPPELIKRPFFAWLSKVKGKDVAYYVLNQIMVENIKRFAAAKNIEGFIKFVKDFDPKGINDIYINGGHRFWREYDKAVTTLVNYFATDTIGKVTDFSDATLTQLKQKYKQIRNFTIELGGIDARVDTEIWGGSFGKIGAYVVALKAYSRAPFESKPTSYKSQVYVKDWFEKAFGPDCMVDPNSTDFQLKKGAFDKAPKDIQQAFLMLVRNKINKAEVVDDSAIGKVWVHHWMTQLPGGTNPTKKLNNFNAIDTTKLTESDIEYAYQEIAKHQHIAEFVKAFRGIYPKNLLNGGKAYFENALKVILKLMKAGKTDDIVSLLYYSSVSEFAFNLITKWIESNYNKDGVEDALIQVLSSTNNDVDLKKKLIKWYLKQVKTGKQVIGANLIEKIYRHYDIDEYVMPSNPEEIDSVFLKLKYSRAIDYLRWLVSNSASLRAKIIAYNETLDVSKISDSMAAGYGIMYPIRFLPDEYITDGIINNFKEQWLKTPAYKLDDISLYSHSKKLTKAYREMLDTALGAPGHEDITFKVVSNSSPDKVSAFFDKMDVPQIVNLLSDQKVPTSDVAQFAGAIKDKKFVKSLSTSGVLKFAQALSESFEKDKKKFEKTYRSNITKDFCEFLGNMKEAGRDDDLEVIYKGLKGQFKKDIVNYFINYEFARQASEKIFSDGTLIKPYEKLDHERLAQVLRYNSIEPPKSSTRELPSFKSLFSKSDLAQDVIEDLKVELVEHKSPESLERKSVEYDVFNKYRHGNIAVRFLREFNVDIPSQRAGQKEFLEYMPDTEKIDPAFHGTGSVAASMILRYGFAVISRGDSSVVGRMLGDGVYFSNVLDKVGQYVSDSGYTRGIGTKGYIFQMTALLGKEGIDYRAAGLGGDNIISPEWCVFQPNKQLRIYKVFEVEIIPKAKMDELKSKYNISEDTAVKIISFKEFLRESQTQGKNVTTYTFVDGTIPIGINKAVDFEEFKPEQYGNHVRLEPSQIGPMVVIEHDGEESEAFCVRFTPSFMKQTDDLQKFLGLLMRSSG